MCRSARGHDRISRVPGTIVGAQRSIRSPRWSARAGRGVPGTTGTAGHSERATTGISGVPGTFAGRGREFRAGDVFEFTIDEPVALIAMYRAMHSVSSDRERGLALRALQGTQSLQRRGSPGCLAPSRALRALRGTQSLQRRGSSGCLAPSRHHRGSIAAGSAVERLVVALQPLPWRCGSSAATRATSHATARSANGTRRLASSREIRGASKTG